MDPVDHVVADVHRVGAHGQQLDLEGVAIAGGLERLVPPARPFEQGRTDRLGRAAVDVVLDRLLCLAHARGGIHLLEAMPPREALDQRRGDRRGVVGVLQRAETRARVIEPRLVVAVGQLGEAVMLAQRDGLRARRDAADAAREHAAAAAAAAAAAPAAGRTAAFIRERQHRVDLGVLREPLRLRQIEGAARPVDAVVPEPRARVQDVAQEEVRGVDQHAPVGLGPYGEAPQDRLRERILDRVHFVGVLAVGAPCVIGLHHHHARPDPLELDDPPLAADPTIEPDVVRPQPRRQAGGVEHLGIELGDLHPERAGLVVPVERQVAVDLLQPRRPGIDGLDWSSLTTAAAPALGEETRDADE